jgi:hypothetical protein
MLGLNPGLLQRLHWQSEALTLRLDLIYNWLDLIQKGRNVLLGQLLIKFIQVLPKRSEISLCEM